MNSSPEVIVSATIFPNKELAMIVEDLSNSFNPVPKTLQKNKSVEKTAVIKKKSSKLTKLERQRDKDLIKKR